MCDGMKCATGNHEEINQRGITIFTAKGCSAYKTKVPWILEKAATAGFDVKVIDVYSEDPEDRKRSSHVRFVPHIEYTGRELCRGEFEKLTSGEIGRG